MKKHTTFRVGGPADLYVCPKKQELPVILGLAKKKGLAVTVIGNGSNLLVGDKGIRGLVIEVGAQMNAVEVQGNILRAQAGALLSQVAAKAAAAGLGGMEFAAGIPGSMGGAVTMNAGAYGGEMKDVIWQVTVLTPECEQKVLSREELDLSYRHSCIPKNHFLVLEAELSLTPAPEQEIRAKMAELRKKRVEKQPLEYPSAGSTFKRSGRLFCRKTDYGCRTERLCSGGMPRFPKNHERFCGINRGNATAAEILQLMKDVQERVKKQSGVTLEPEVKMIGEF